MQHAHFAHTKSPQTELYHGHVHVARPYDKHSKLYHPEVWNWHDIYDKHVSYEGSIVTRSQTAFNRMQISDKETKLFTDKTLQHPPNLPHLIMTMKDGMYGAIPRTIITRSLANHLEINPTLTKTIEAYETFHPLHSPVEIIERKNLESSKTLSPKREPLEKKEEATSRRNPSMTNRFFGKNPYIGTDIKPELTNDENEMDVVVNSTPGQDSIEGPQLMEESLKYDEQPSSLVDLAKPTLEKGKSPLIRESLFSQAVLKNLSQSRVSSVIGGLNKIILKEPSFVVTPSQCSLPLRNSWEMESQSGEAQEFKSPLTFSGGARSFRSPSPKSRDVLHNRLKSLSEFHKKTSLGKLM